MTGVAALGLLVCFGLRSTFLILQFQINSDLLFILLIVKDVGGSKCLLFPPKMTFSDYRAEAEWLLSIK